jgi:hypothetical protein
MKALSTSADTARIEALLSRLDPEPGVVCTVPGCLHLHQSATSATGTPQPIAA